MNKPPSGPLVVSVLVLAACTGYWLSRLQNTEPIPSGFSGPPGAGVVRVVTWNLERSDVESGAPLSADAIGHVTGVLNRLAPTAVLLQGLVSEANAAAVRAGLSGDWLGESVLRRRDGQERLAVFVRHSAESVDRALVNTPVGDRALAYRVDGPDRKAYRFVCVHADSADAARRQRYCDGVLDWLERQRPALTVMAGDFGIDVGATKDSGGHSSDNGRKSSLGRISGSLVDCGPPDVSTLQGGGRVDHVFVTPNSGSARSAVVDGARRSSILHSPVVVDLIP